MYVVMAALAAGLFLVAMEYMAGLAGLELRTFAEAGKGMYLWLVMPFIILIAGNGLLRHILEGRCRKDGGTDGEGSGFYLFLNRLRKVLFVAFMPVICIVAFLRGVMYVFSADMVTEKMLPDGYIEGTWSEFLSESHHTYYVRTGGIFRRPFPGWSREELTRIVRENYNAQAEYVEAQEDGMHVFRISDDLEEGGYIYFHVLDSYQAGSNYFFQVLRSEAAHFWGGRSRTVTVRSEREMTLEEAEDMGQVMTGRELYARAYLSVTCGSSEAEISACAADMTDWLRFVKDAGQFPYEKAEALHLLTEMVLGSGQETFHFSLRSPEVYMGDIPWDERYHRMKKAIEERFDAYYVWLGERREQEVQWQEESEEDDSSFMDIYNGGYEKEYLVGDGTVRYRMVVEDAALGSRFYGLLKSMDGGQTWQMSNPDPFDQQTGMGIDFIFLDESFGFASLMYNGGDEAVLYVTKDGGDSYRPVVIEGYTVTLENGDTYDPYDYPRMPYEEDGRLFLQCGQGADGDYAGGDTAGLALYESMDGGDTFVFREIRENSKTG